MAKVRVVASQNNPPAIGGLSHQFRQASQVIAILVATLGIVVLCGWAFGIPTLTYIQPAFQSMKVNTALSFLLLGAGLWLAHNDDQKRIRCILGLFVVAIACAALAEYALNVSLGIDQLLFRDTRTSAYPGRMALPTAISFLFLGLAVTFLGIKKAIALRRALVTASFALSLVALCGYLYGVKSLYSITSFSTMAVHTAAGLLAASLAYFLARPDEGLVSIAANGRNSGLLVRTLLPAIIGVPILIGWLRMLGQRANLYDTPFGVALQVLGSIGCLAALTVLIARSMNRLESEHSRAEQKIRDSEERMRLAHQVARMGAFEWNIQTGVNLWSPELEALYGLAPGSSGKTLSAFENLVHPDDRARVRQLMDLCLKNRRAEDGEWRTVWPDGSVHWLAGRSQLFTDGLGEPLRLIGIVSDITERKRAEEVLSDMSRKLLEAHEQERTRIARELHDDINQRLALFAVELETLLKEHVDMGEVLHRVPEIRDQIVELSADVQALSHELHPSKLEYLGAVAGIKSWCKEFSERQKVQIAFHSAEIPRFLPREISLCLFRVLQESVHNAAKHSGANTIEVRLQADPGEIRLIIRDSGRGFDVNAAMQGHGLGLTSMQERVRLVNGNIVIQSTPMVGTTIDVRVPFLAEHTIRAG